MKVHHLVSHAAMPDICSPLARPVTISNKIYQAYASGDSTVTAFWRWLSYNASMVVLQNNKRVVVMRQVECRQFNHLRNLPRSPALYLQGSRRVNHLVNLQASLPISHLRNLPRSPALYLLGNRRVNHLVSLLFDRVVIHLDSLLSNLQAGLVVARPLCAMLVSSSSTAPMACIPVTCAAALLVNQGSLTRNLGVLAKRCVAPALAASMRTNLAVQSASQPLLGPSFQRKGQPALRSVHNLLILPLEVMWHVRLALLVGSLPEKVRLGSWIACPRSGILSRAALLLCY